jgi:hypothetical protein
MRTYHARTYEEFKAIVASNYSCDVGSLTKKQAGRACRWDHFSCPRTHSISRQTYSTMSPVLRCSGSTSHV